MLFACVFPNLAAADTELSSVDAEKLEAFFAQSAGDGRHNFDHPDYAGGVYGSYTVSNFSESPCVGIEDGVIRWFDFNPDAMGSILRTSPVLDFRPRFCGVFDLSGTSVTNVYSPVPGQTHITAVNLDGCANLECLEFGDQNECFDISALNCPNLNIIDLRTYHSGNVAVQPKSFSAPVMLNTLGNGGSGTLRQGRKLCTDRAGRSIRRKREPDRKRRLPRLVCERSASFNRKGNAAFGRDPRSRLLCG